MLQLAGNKSLERLLELATISSVETPCSVIMFKFLLPSIQD